MKRYKDGDNLAIFSRHLEAGLTEVEADILTLWEGLRDRHRVLWCYDTSGDRLVNVGREHPLGLALDIPMKRLRSFRTLEELREAVETEYAIAKLKGA